MSGTKSKEVDELVPTAVKIPRAMNDRIEELAQFVRGGKSEVIRRAIQAGLPVVIVQRGIRIPERKTHK
jgi:predicted DNA-binding protein